MTKTDIITGLCAGDCSKGKISFSLLKQKERTKNKYTCVVVASGGPNRGHTIYHKDVKYILHQIPCGVLLNKLSIIGAGCVVDVDKLFQEAKYLESCGFNVFKNLRIAYNAHIITKEHLEEDKGGGTIGSTSCGIMQAYRSKYGRTGIRAESILALRPYLVDTIKEFHNNEHYILVEGSQGALLCPDWGIYPFVTAGIPTSTYALHSLGLNTKNLNKVIGCMKAYNTYSGNRQNFSFGSDEDKEIYKQIIELGQEKGNTTGRERKICWNDFGELKKAILLNGCDEIIVSKMDILDIIKVWRYFDINGDKQELFSSESYENSLRNFLQSLGVKKVIFSRTPYSI